jgi:hypothetical protein
MKRTAILLTLVTLLLLAASALAMSSASYRLDWFTPLTSSGGGPASSASYVINLTVGQTIIGDSANEQHQVGLGYWYGIVNLDGQWHIHLPLILR